LSGGECTLAKDLPEFVKLIKAMGFKIKIDTNGSKPRQIEKLLSGGCLDYVALDYKAPLNKLIKVAGNSLSVEFKESLGMLCRSNVKLEIRTTVHSEFLDENDINLITEHLQRHNFKGLYTVQNYRECANLGNIANQSHVINRDQISQDRPFEISFRNF
jgi:pyruvate formate lyase activating enzyme